MTKTCSQQDKMVFTSLVENLLPIDEAAALVNRDTDTIKMHVMTGRIWGWKFGGERRGLYLVYRPSLLAYYAKKHPL